MSKKVSRIFLIILAFLIGLSVIKADESNINVHHFSAEMQNLISKDS